MISPTQPPQLSRLALDTRASETMAAANASTGHARPINLSLGEPVEAPPPEVCEAALRAVRDGVARYGPPAGLPRLRELAAEDQQRKTGIERSPDEIIVTAGGKPALLEGLRCLIDPGDEVLVPAPYWPSFLQQIELAGGVARIAPPGPELLPDPLAIAQACTPRTRVLILNDPGNPTSLAAPPELLRRLAQLAAERGLWILADQVYADLDLRDAPTSLLHAAPEARQRTLVVESFSKRFSMTGYRLGYAAGPGALIEAMTRLATASTTCVNAIAQHAGIAALSLDGTWLEQQRARYRRRCERMSRHLRTLGCTLARRPDAAFYLFFGLPEGVDDVAAARTLREREGLSLVPGSAFGMPARMRLSCTASDEQLDEAAERLARFFAG